MPVNILKTKQNKTKERGIFNWNVLGLAPVMGAEVMAKGMCEAWKVSQA